MSAEELVFNPALLARVLPLLPPLEGRAQGPTCNARTRLGAKCQNVAVWDPSSEKPRRRNGRCRMHGGFSTGPRTPEGRAAIAASNRRRAKSE